MIWAVGLVVGIWVDYNMTIVYIVAGVMAGLIFLSGIGKAVKTQKQETS
jgi:hypothetical protein